MGQERDHYIDFLRTLGLILLIGVHVDAPEWYVPMRSFDVPLMVFVSSICYKPLRGGILEYAYKRLRRLYLPVFIFLTLFVGGYWIYSVISNNQMIPFKSIAGSYLLLNSPSIGFVWIMRVFIMIALVLPPVEKGIRNLRFHVIGLIVFLLIILQQCLIYSILRISNLTFSFILTETVVYVVGYLPFAILGLSIKKLNKKGLIIWTIVCGAGVLLMMAGGNSGFNPQNFKYPPRLLYILYGILACSVLWLVRPRVEKYVSGKVISFFSANSMWIYLWHIIPVYIVGSYIWPVNTWFLRYIIVVGIAVLLFLCYNGIAGLFSPGVRKYLR